MQTPPSRPSTHRQRSNSFPIVEALGCSAQEAHLILAEGRAAVRKRRARGRRNRSVNDDDTTTTTTTFDPRHHMHHLDQLPPPLPSHARTCHARIPSNTTDRSISTIVPTPPHDASSPASPLGNYSANLAQFIKAQLKSIPTYQPKHDSLSSLSPQSCPDFTFPMRTPPLSPDRPVRRPADAPTAIEIPPVRPPARSAFSAWSSTDDDTDDDAASLPDWQRHVKTGVDKGSTYTPSLLGYYETPNSASFLFSSTPLEEEDEPDTAKASTFAHQDALPASANDSQDDDGDYPSSSLSRPQLSTSSAPSYSSSSASTSSYFDSKRPLAMAPNMKHRIVAALTPSQPPAKVMAAISPWEGGAIANVHDVFVESQQRVHVDGMSFDMLGDFTMPGRVTTPC